MATTTPSTLSDLYAPVFSYVLAVEDHLAQQKDFPKSALDVAHDLQNLLEQISNKALQMGHGRSEVETAKFAIVAWIDEIFARYPQWSSGYTPLQIIYFATNNAGNEFFDKLDELAEGQIELRTLFFLILCLGFVGEYYLDTGPHSSLERIKELTSKKIGITLPIIGALDQERITPQPYLSQDPHPPLRRRFIPWYYWVGALAALLLILGIILLLMRSRPSIDDIRPQVQAILDSFTCSQTNAAIAENDGFSIEITGFVKQNQDKGSMKEQLLAIEHVNSVNVDPLIIYPWPACELLVILNDYTDIADGKAGFPRIRPTSQGLTFQGGEPLLVSLSAPSQPSYIYAGYLQNDGMVIHFIPTDLLPNNKMEPNGTMIIGEVGTSPRQYTIQPPYGTDVLFILSSSEPLFTAPRTEIERSEPFFTALLEKLKQLGTTGNTPVKSDYYIIETAP